MFGPPPQEYRCCTWCPDMHCAALTEELFTKLCPPRVTPHSFQSVQETWQTHSPCIPIHYTPTCTPYPYPLYPTIHPPFIPTAYHPPSIPHHTPSTLIFYAHSTPVTLCIPVYTLHPLYPTMYSTLYTPHPLYSTVNPYPLYPTCTSPSVFHCTPYILYTQPHSLYSVHSHPHHTSSPTVQLLVNKAMLNETNEDVHMYT